MRLSKNGHVFEVPMPDSDGNGVVLFNGEVVERVRYSDAEMTFTLSDGTVIDSPREFGKRMAELAEALVERRTM